MDDRVKNMDDLWRESKQEFPDAIVLISLNSNWILDRCFPYHC